MAYRRRHSSTKSTTFEDFRLEEPPSPLPAQPARASSAYSRSASFTSSSVSAYRDSDRRRRTQFQSPLISENHHQSTKVPTSWGGSDKIASSPREIGGTSKSEIEEEHMTADMIQETGKLQIRRKPGVSDTTFQFAEPSTPTNLNQNQVGLEVQAKASGDIANVMAAKAKLLLRELKTVKADLATAKERCAKLEEENKALRESRQKGDTPADDDLIRLQLETLLAEKARLAHENSIYARENRFLRETVEYHQFTMQEDIVYLDGQGIEEEEAEDEAEAEAYPIHQMQPFHTPLQSVPEASSSPIPSTPSPSMHSSSELNTTTAETIPSAEGSMLQQQQQQPYPC
ncbi:hypothetical protein OPV22_018637 [Ensete ventricosum]|uniref:Uncharacterized protein n=1 Tax=Ensete ventricosum TaxID=4639 RepID=A0AAV8QUN0_ENSVE|nr:hypothetical protein OPV22_018637 [Ensete ventricosum]